MASVPDPQTACFPLIHADAALDLARAVLAQALTDLKPSADPYVRASALRFWRNERGSLAWWCGLLDLDVQQVQAHVARRYPEVLAPRQLELDLEVA